MARHSVSLPDAASLFSELARLTRSTPSIARRRVSSRATWTWLFAQPMRSIAGTGSAERSVPPPPPPSTCYVGDTVPMSEVNATSAGTTRATSRRLSAHSKRPSSRPVIVVRRAVRRAANSV